MPAEKSSAPRFSWIDGWVFLLIFVCWMVGSTYQILKNFPHDALLFCLAGAAGVGITLALLRWLQARRDKQIAWGWLTALWAMLFALYLILYPISQRHVLGVGSDSEDALRITVNQILHHHYPYYVRTYLHNLVSPMPGAIFLAVPFYFLGRVSFQNVAWLAAFVIFCASFFRQRSTALAFLLVLVLASAGTLDAFVVGDDYVTNAWYICILVYVFLRTFERNGNQWQNLISGILLGIALASRPTFVVIPPLILAYLLQRGRGATAALRTAALPIAVAAAVTLPFYFYDPNHFSPLHIQGKLSFLPPESGHVLTVALPLLALAVACGGFFIQLTFPRLFLLAGLAIGIITFTPALLEVVVNGFSSRAGWGLMDYSIPSATYIGLWAFSRYERVLPAQLGSPVTT